MKKGDMLLLALDLKKDPETIRQAYSCPKELLNKFVWNNFARINKELEGNFEYENFDYCAYYDCYIGKILEVAISRCNHTVSIRN